MNKIPVIIDCDPGHDDAIALITALASDRLDVLGITAAAGNQTVDKTEKNARKILEICARTDIPVTKGRTAPLLQSLHVARDIHGESGMDGPVLPEPTFEPAKEPAEELIARLVEECETPVTLIITGTCTNIAVFLLAYPHLHRKIARISLMGGGAFLGNRTPLAEFNIWADPEAARIVMDSQIPLEVYGLDVTHKALIYQEEFELFRKEEGAIFQLVAGLLDFFSASYLNERKMNGGPIHDACAVMGVIYPELFTYRETHISVELESRESRGALTMDLRPKEKREKQANGKIALDVDRDKFLQLLLESCKILTAERRKKGYDS
ncbi:MAG: nucleoside hydrolase [Lachnospiraceae bacterium]|jgi:pyrimidine-specific ribonucleoside hydrolase|nr:nucleoside hydrolase [Lachnospiraceae bacterium]